MTTPEAIKSVMMTYFVLKGKNEEQSEAFYEDYAEKFGKGNLIVNACCAAFELELRGPAVKKLRAALRELNTTGEIKE